MIDEYRRSLKMPAAEEVFDLFFYRPLAFVLVKLVYRTRITPNQITYLSFAAGCTAAWLYSRGDDSAAVCGALWYAGANILDCADGQLARLQKSGTLYGRVVDGVIDYLSSIAIFLGIGIGLSAMGKSFWLLVVAAGLSSALQAIFSDRYQSEYISTVRSERNFLERELMQFREELLRLHNERRILKSYVVRCYVRYLEIQKKLSTKRDAIPFTPELYAEGNRTMIRFWSILGPTTNRTALIVCTLCGNIPVYLWSVTIGGNFLLIVCAVAQRRIQSRMEATRSSMRDASEV